MDNAQSDGEFPSWAPCMLVAEYYRILEVEKETLELVEKEKTKNGMIGFYSEENVVKTIRKIRGRDPDILYRLLTNDKMESVWKTVKNTKSIINWDDEIKPTFVWSAIQRALAEFNADITYGKTAFQKKEHLNKILKKANELRALMLVGYHELIEIDKYLLSSNLGKIIIDEANNSAKFPGAYDVYMQGKFIDIDIKQARSIISNYPEKIQDEKDILNPWFNKTNLERLTIWCEKAKDTRLSTLLGDYARRIELLANSDFKIKNPERGNAAFKGFLIREINGVMTSVYGEKRPLHSANAAIVSVVLGLKKPFERDDIRPYLSGKKVKAGVVPIVLPGRKVEIEAKKHPGKKSPPTA